MEEWFERAVGQPWAFIALLILWFLWKSGKWLGGRLFDEESGIVPTFVADIKSDSKATKDSIAGVARTNTEALLAFQAIVTKGLKDNKDAVSSLERQLVSAIQAKPKDEELFKVLFDENPIPICFVGDDNKFTKVNRACEDFWGYSAGELIDMTFADITLESDIHGDIENVQRVKAGSLSQYRMQKTYINKNEKQVKAALHVFRYPEAGAFLHYISIIVPL